MFVGYLNCLSVRSLFFSRLLAVVSLCLLLSMPAQAEIRFKDFFENHNAIVLLIEPQTGKIIDANPSAAAFYGYSRDELRTMGIQDINTLTREEVAEERARAKEEKRNFFIFRHKLKNGSIKTVEVHSNPFEYKGLTVLLSIIHDISKQREIQNDLWHYQRQLEQMVDRQTEKLLESQHAKMTFLVIGIIVLGSLTVALFVAVKQQSAAKQVAMQKRRELDEIIWSTNVGTFEWNILSDEVRVNERYAAMLGYSREELDPFTFETWAKLTHPEDVPVTKSLLEKNLAGQIEHYETEYRMFHKNGSMIWILSKGNVVEWSSLGKPLRMSGTHADITARKNMELELLNAKKLAEKASHAKSEFLATMSHELRTPMMGIRGVLELLRSNEIVLEQERELLDDLDESSANLMSLLNDILDLSKIEAGQLRLDSYAHEPAQIIDSVVSLFTPGAVKKGIDITSNVHELSDYWCNLDDIRFRQIVSNLISNAVKFTEEGKVHVAMKVEKASEGDTLIVDVIDSGIGIAPEHLGRIFKRFSQADQSLSKKYGGTGLGLAISHELCEMMGGELHVESKLGEGSVFSISLPVKAANKPEAAVEKHSRLEVLNILMAEDNLINQKVVYSMLTKKGHVVTIAQNGLEAVDEANKEVFDLILMDIQMPEMDGVEATRRIRDGNGPNARKPIIAFTADAVKEHHSSFKDAGIDAIVIKPVKFDRLFDEIAKLV